jgi:hypothetical protein
MAKKARINGRRRFILLRCAARFIASDSGFRGDHAVKRDVAAAKLQQSH